MNGSNVTKYAADKNGIITLLVDVRGQAQERSIRVWSPGKKKAINLPRSLIQIHNDEFRRWAAVSLPRWLANDRGLHGATVEPYNKADEAEQRLAKWKMENVIATRRFDERRAILRKHGLLKTAKSPLSMGGVFENPGR